MSLPLQRLGVMHVVNKNLDIKHAKPFHTISLGMKWMLDIEK